MVSISHTKNLSSLYRLKEKMLNPQVQFNSSRTLSLFPNPFIKDNTLANFLDDKRSNKFPSQQRKCRIGYKPNKTKACVVLNSLTAPKSYKMKATVTIRLSVKECYLPNAVLDGLIDLIGKTLRLELFSAELDPSTGREKDTITAYAHKSGREKEDLKFEAEFMVPVNFGEVGAVFVKNEHHTELYLKEIVLDGRFTTFTVTCNSWIHSKFDNKEKRVFFTNKSYLPSETPNALKRLREEELVALRGNGRGERKRGERIYDYDVYNDLGNPDESEDMKRPVLGGKENPYPRRCRTGRELSDKDRSSESRPSGIFVYVPRDEEFSLFKLADSTYKLFQSVLHDLIPFLDGCFEDKDLGFPFFPAIDSLYNEGINLPLLESDGGLWGDLLHIIKYFTDASNKVLKFETPQTMKRDRFFWFRDEEFARQTLAGLNPCKLELVTEWPLKSSLDPAVYGPPESAITTEMVEREIIGFMTVEEAVKEKKLFMLDYHDLLLPFVSKVRELENTTLYGSRALFFLTPDGTLKPLAIELVRPPMDGKPQWKEAYSPSNWDATGDWLWKLAKAHVLAHDSGYHQLISHWLRTHCCVEPYIIAANRQLSEMHPIYRLLHPHFRYTMEINALARLALIEAGGTIEACFSPGKYSMLLSSVIYGKEWRFDHQALPNDLISRGLAVKDPSAPNGLKLTIEDYPYANDGLVLWDILKQWVSDYVNHYYPDPKLISEDHELQAWWNEVRNVGHGDKKDESWWPELKTPADLIEIVTTIMWTASGQHAAVNFGQYAYAGFFPNRPTVARINMPTEDPNLWKFFQEKPETFLLTTFPSQYQATKVMIVLNVLSNHSPDEEYLGQEIEPAWVEEPHIKAAFEKFNGRLMELEGIIDERNADIKLKNRNGVGVLPYKLLKPNSKAGVTGEGVPYSISI